MFFFLLMGITLPFHIRAINHVINWPLCGTFRHKGFIGGMILIIDLANISYTIVSLNVESVEKPAKWLSLRFPKAIAAPDIIIFIIAVQGSRDAFAFTLKACATIVQSRVSMTESEGSAPLGRHRQDARVHCRGLAECAVLKKLIIAQKVLMDWNSMYRGYICIKYIYIIYIYI